MNAGATDAVERALAAQQAVVRDAAEQTESMARDLALPIGESAWAGAARAAYDNAVDGLRSTLARASWSLRSAEAETAVARVLQGQAAAGASLGVFGGRAGSGRGGGAGG